MTRIEEHLKVYAFSNYFPDNPDYWYFIRLIRIFRVLPIFPFYTRGYTLLYTFLRFYALYALFFGFRLFSSVAKTDYRAKTENRANRHFCT